MAIATTTAILVGAGIAAAGATGAAAISSRAQKKAASRAEELAREQQQTALAEQKRLEEKYKLTPGELSREQRLLGRAAGEEPVAMAEEGFEARRQKELERRGGLTGEELLRETGPETRRLLDEISSRFGKTGEELFKAEGELPRQLAEQATSGKPLAMFEGELELARQMVNAEANRRGVFGGLPEGGIRFEQLGRTGVDLAIKSARERMAQQNTLVNAYFGLSAGARGEAGTVAERALTTSERARAELAQFLQDLQAQSTTSKGRAATAGLQAANIMQPSVAQSYQDRIGIEGFRGGIVGPAEAGLSAIGDIGATILANELFKTPAPTSRGADFEELLRTSPYSTPRLRFSELTGGAYGR